MGGRDGIPLMVVYQLFFPFFKSHFLESQMISSQAIGVCSIWTTETGCSDMFLTLLRNKIGT